MYATIPEIQQLKKTIGEEKIRQIFLKHPKKIYTNSALNFITKLLLPLTKHIDKQKYLKHAPRNIRQQ
jgi:hypothetical protein